MARSANASRPTWYDSEIHWWVNEWEGEAGVCGLDNEARCMRGRGGETRDRWSADHDGISDAQVRAASRARKVERAMARLPAWERQLLRLAHRLVSPRTHVEVQKQVEAVRSEAASQIALGVLRFRAAWKGAA